MASDERLRIDVRRDRGAWVLALHGELDLATADGLAVNLEQTAADAPFPVVLDLSDLEFIDSTGLRSILVAHEQASRLGRPFAVMQGSAQVKRLMDITRISEHLRIVASPEDFDGA